jgi:methyltransferase family protein
MAFTKLFQYYEHEQFLPTFGNFENVAKLAQYAAARRAIFAEKLALPVQIFDNANVLEFGPDTGENALVFAQWGANLTLAEPNKRAHDQIRNYFKRFALGDRLRALGESDIEGFTSDERYDIIDAEGFIYTVQPTSLWLQVFGANLKSGGHAIVSYYETHGTFIELALKAIHWAYKALTSLPPEEAALKLYENKWNSIPHTRAFASWVHDVLENPFVRLRYFLGASDLCRLASEHAFDVHSSWPCYRDLLDIYWHKKALSPAEQLKRNTIHLDRSALSFLSGQKMYLVGGAAEIAVFRGVLNALVADMDALIEQPLGKRLPVLLSGLRQLRQSVSTTSVLVDDEAAVGNFQMLLQTLESIFSAILRKDPDEIARMTNSDPSFISAWGMPTHFLVLRRRLDVSPEAV